MTRFPRLLPAAACGVVVGVVTAAGWNITAPPELASPPGGVEPAAAQGADQLAGGNDGGGAQGKNQSVVKPPPAHPTYELLDQPGDPYPTPELPAAPGEESPELTRISYELEKLAWIAAGVVDDDTETTCSEGEDELSEDALSEPGDYEFSCQVAFSGTSVRFNVAAEVSRTEVQWEWTAREFAVSEEKVTHEATRQAFKPARVTCNFSGMELVRIGVPDAISCWVTGADGDQMTYHGELLRDGSLVFRPVQPRG